MKQLKQYPFLLGKLPLFLPKKHRRLNGEPITYGSAWGTVTFHNQFLTTTDESIFIEVFSSGFRATEEVTTITYTGNLYGLAQSIGMSHGTSTYTVVSNSLSALTETAIEISVGENSFKGKLMYTKEKAPENKGSQKLAVAINPRLMCIVQQYDSVIDINLRKKLSPTGKALYRFLNAMDAKGGVMIETVRKAIAPHYRHNDFSLQLIKELRKLKEHGFIKQAVIDTNGKIQFEKNRDEPEISVRI